MQLCTKGKVQVASQKGPKFIFRERSLFFFATKPVVPVSAEEELHFSAGVNAGEDGGARVPASSLPLAFHGETYMA